MNNFVAILIIVSFAILVFYGTKLKKFNLNYLSLDNSKSIKTICALTVMLHHITNYVNCGLLFLPFQVSGYLMVAVFFFYSGYGIMFSLEHKTGYIENFLRKRLFGLLIPYFIANAIYILIKSFFGKINIQYLINSFILGTPVVNNSWFIISLAILYLFFWLSFRWTKNRKISWLIFLLLFSIYFLNFKFVYWSPAIITFLLGMLWSCEKNYIDKILARHNISILILIAVLFLIFFALKVKFSSGAIEAVCSIFCSLFFVSFVICLQTRVILGNFALYCLYKISFEIYLYHGLSIYLLKHLNLFESNCYSFLLTVVISTIIISIIVNKFNKLILSKIQ